MKVKNSNYNETKFDEVNYIENQLHETQFD
jgi:hypothetical protein